MSLIEANIQWIMLVAGLLTLTIVRAVFAPKAAARAYFGEALEGPAADLVVRNWGVLIAFSALFLLYAAFVDPALRVAAVVFSAAGKACFIGLVVAHRRAFAGNQALMIAAVDSIFILLFTIYLLARLA